MHNAGVANSPYCDAEVVDVYDRLAVPLQFAAPARDLVAAMHLRTGDRVLDVGTGTGAAATAAAAAVSSGGMVVGIDPSLLMLGRLRNRGTVCVAAARVPNLPFRKSCFDAVMASFVLTHMEDIAEGLVEMTRLLRPGGRLGVTSWGDTVTPVSQLWTDVVTGFTSADELKRALRVVIPGDGWLSNEANLRRALRGARLRGIAVSRREYSVTLGVGEYLSLRVASVEGVLLRRRLTNLEWTGLRQDLAERFRSRFGEFVTYVRDVHLGVATKQVG